MKIQAKGHASGSGALQTRIYGVQKDERRKRMQRNKRSAKMKDDFLYKI